MELLSSFIFCETTLKQINDLPDDLRLKFYEAVAAYGIYNIEPHFTGLENTVWIAMKDIIDTTRARREEKQKAGKAGGEAKRDNAKNKAEQTGAEDTKSKQDIPEDTNPYQDVAEDSKNILLQKTVAEDSNPYQPLPNGNGNGNGNVNDNENGNGNGNGNSEHFSFSESLNPNLPDFSHRLKKLKNYYNNLKIGPPFKKLAVNLNASELSDLMMIMQVYPDDVSIKAMENYAAITGSPDYDPGGCTYRGFISFMIRGVEKYCDEANPFEAFKKKQGASPPAKGPDWGGAVNMGKGVKAKQFFGGAKDE